MNFCSFVLVLNLISFSKAYKYYPTKPPTEVISDYCILGNNPVCGTNGHEYFRLDNECEFNNFNSKQLEIGQMVLSKTSIKNCYPSFSPPAVYDPSSYTKYCPQYCNKMFKPVCAIYHNVQRTFNNECELKKYICDTKTNWQIISNSACVAASCALDGQEVCVSYNNYTQSFPNLLSLYGDILVTGKNWQILNIGPCPCPTDYRPICAQLNCTVKTFQNECFLEKEIKNGNLWSLLFFGECPLLPITTTTVAPIIGVTAAPPNVPTTEAVTEISVTEISVTDTTTGVINGTSPAVANITAVSNLLYGPNTAINNKPVYIVRKNKINPYVPQQYKPKVKAPPAYKPLNAYNPSSPKKSTPNGMPNKLPCLETPLVPSSPKYQGSNKSTYYLPAAAPTLYNTGYYPSKAPVTITSSNYNVPKINCGGKSYDTALLLDSLYESFT